MQTRARLHVAVIGMIFTACSSDKAQQTQPAATQPELTQAAIPPVKILKRDTHSYAVPEVARVTHVSLDLDVDFAQQILKGTATLTVTAAAKGATLTLDVKGLDIQTVKGGDGKKTLKHSLGDNNELLGQPLAIELGPEAGEHTVRIAYQTRPGAAALQFLSPEQTLGKKQPYLFTQGQAILTRTYIPLQDTPGVRITYDAVVRVPKGLKAVMSAEHLTPEGEPDGERTLYRFKMPQPIPAYLIALAVGDLGYRELGPRTGVWAEPAFLDTAANEFADIEAMMTACEELYGPYRWGRYEVLVLPPSFPFGGMENPRLTFLSPTTVAGDKSLPWCIIRDLGPQ